MSALSRRAAVLLVVVLLTACGTWQRVDRGSTRYSGSGYTLDLPVGWVRLEDETTLLLSRDGPTIQRIAVRHAPHADAFPKLKKSSSTSLLALELADLYVAELRASDKHGLPTLRVLASQPVQIGGSQGFQLHLYFKNVDGLGYEQIAQGFVDGSGYYTLTYTATSLHYFARNRADFDTLAASFRRTGR